MLRATRAFPSRSVLIGLAFAASVPAAGCSDDVSGGNGEQCSGETWGNNDEVGDGEGSLSDEGCAFLPGCAEGEDEGATAKLDIGLPEEPDCEPDCPPPPPIGIIADPPDPDDWAYDKRTDSYYRLATEAERENNRWPRGTVVISAPRLVDALTHGSDADVTMALPVASPGGDLELQRLEIKRRRSRADVLHVSSQTTPAGVVDYAFRPEFHMYFPSWVEPATLSRGAPSDTSAFVIAFGDSHGGVAIQGMTPNQEFLVAGPTTKAWLEQPAPDNRGVLVSKPTFKDTEFRNVLGHWLELGAEYCASNQCFWEEDTIELEPANCGDGIDNDWDCATDQGDWLCQHHRDFGCDNFGDHNHRWENTKDFAELPDIEWCTAALEDGMPWHTLLYSKATMAAALLNAIPTAMAVHPDLDPPNSSVPTIQYRFAYCVFSSSTEAAAECTEYGTGCPSGYQLGGVTHVLNDNDVVARTTYFRSLWVEFDVAMHKAENQGITPKPVTLVSGVYSGDILDSKEGLNPSAAIGLAARIGNYHGTNPEPSIYGASTMEADTAGFVTLAHELGHTLGLSHADLDDHFETWGFMFRNSAAKPYAILGPSEDYPLSNVWQFNSEWNTFRFITINQDRPRPSGFAHTGCSGESQCGGESCWNAGPEGVCLMP